MRVRQLHIRNFRGFSALELRPGGTHCVLVGEPGAGRSDIIEGLSRVLALDVASNALPDEYDFNDRRLTQRAEVEITLGDLSEEMKHTFLDRLELWNGEAATLVGELADAQDMDAERFEAVVRICYRAQWSEVEEAATHWVDFAKTSDPATESWDRLGRAQRALLPFVRLRPSSRTLELAPGTAFRHLVEAAAGDDLAAALEALADALEQSADRFATSEQVRAAMETILGPVRSSLARGGNPVDVNLGFLVHGGSLFGVLRTLETALQLPSDSLRLPLLRHGSSTVTAIRVAQALAVAALPGAVAAIDDLGEDLDSPATETLATVLARTSNQLFLSTRRAAAAAAFEVDDLVRLARVDGRRVAYVQRPPRTRKERSTARQMALQLLPAMTARTLVIVEGPHDSAGYGSLGRRLCLEEGDPLLADFGATMIDAGGSSGSGGVGRIPALTVMARRMGFRVVAVVDGDPGPRGAMEALAAAEAANALVRLPVHDALENALTDGVAEDVIRDVMVELCAEHAVAFDAGLAGKDLLDAVRKILKKEQVHAQLVDALPEGHLPDLGRRVMHGIIAAVMGQDGIIDS